MGYKKLVDEQRVSKSTNYDSYFFCPFQIQWLIQNTRYKKLGFKWLAALKNDHG